MAELKFQFRESSSVSLLPFCIDNKFLASFNLGSSAYKLSHNAGLGKNLREVGEGFLQCVDMPVGFLEKHGIYVSVCPFSSYDSLHMNRPHKEICHHREICLVQHYQGHHVFHPRVVQFWVGRGHLGSLSPSPTSKIVVSNRFLGQNKGRCFTNPVPLTRFDMLVRWSFNSCLYISSSRDPILLQRQTYISGQICQKALSYAKQTDICSSEVSAPLRIFLLG